MNLVKVIAGSASFLVGTAGILAGILNKYGGRLSEDMDIVFYLVGVIGLVVAGIAGYLLVREK